MLPVISVSPALILSLRHPSFSFSSFPYLQSVIYQIPFVIILKYGRYRITDFHGVAYQLKKLSFFSWLIEFFWNFLGIFVKGLSTFPFSVFLSVKPVCSHILQSKLYITNLYITNLCITSLYNDPNFMTWFSVIKRKKLL